jgi:hypothetical protein
MMDGSSFNLSIYCDDYIWSHWNWWQCPDPFAGEGDRTRGWFLKERYDIP